MTGCNYTSVATVSLHVNNLIKRGHLVKREHNARSIEVVKSTSTASVTTNQVNEREEKWLVDKVSHYFTEAEQSAVQEHGIVDNLQTLVSALQVLGLDGAAEQFSSRLSALQQPVMEAELA